MPLKDGTGSGCSNGTAAVSMLASSTLQGSLDGRYVLGKYDIWLVVSNIFSIIYGISSFSLTNSIIFQDGYCTTNQIWSYYVNFMSYFSPSKPTLPFPILEILGSPSYDLQQSGGAGDCLGIDHENGMVSSC